MSTINRQYSSGFADIYKAAYDKGGFATNVSATPDTFKQQWASTFRFSREKLSELENLTEEPTRDNFLAPLDDIHRHLTNIRGLCWTFESCHPDPVMREAVETVSQELDKAFIEMEQSTRVAYIMEAVDQGKLDDLDKRFVAHWKRDFRRAGCFLSPDHREQVKQLSAREAELGRQFDRNIVKGQRSMFVTPDQLKGMSEDFVRAHPVRDDGKVEIKTTYADRMPIMEFCEDDDVRKTLWFLSNQIATPENEPLLKEIIETRARLGKLLGYANFASYSLDPEMIASPENALKLIEELHHGTADKLAQEKSELQSVMSLKDPLSQWQVYYAKNMLAKRNLGGFSPLDSEKYFRVSTVIPGLLKHAERFYGVKYVPRPDIQTWYETVLSYDVYDEEQSDKLLGRIYIDHIMRKDREQHPMALGLTAGVEGKQLASAVLLVGLAPEEDATMPYWDAVSCWHELGHTMHHVLAGQRQRYHRFSGMIVERDFVEAPSQLAENWLKIPEVIKSFAISAEGETIPDVVIENLLKSEEYTKCIYVSSKMVLARMSLLYHEIKPDAPEQDFNRLWREVQRSYGGFPEIPSDAFYRPELSFAHFYSYGPRYIAYANSLAICNELLEVWKKSPRGLLDIGVSRQYRREILEKGSTLDGTEMVRNFLGRAHTTQGYLKWLNA